MKIDRDARRIIADTIKAENVHWYGRLGDVNFLSRLYDLQKLPSKDFRYRTAADDIHQHTIANFDWEPDWVFYDSRFKLSDCDDDQYLRFLSETLHPAVGHDIAEVERMKELYNRLLEHTGFQLLEQSTFAGRPVYAGQHIGFHSTPVVHAAKKVFLGTDIAYVTQQIKRMEEAVVTDPALAIGTAKELVETCCRTILEELGVDAPVSIDLPPLVKLTAKQLQLTPEDISNEAIASEVIKRLLNNLASITNGLAELRNKYGTGHGKTKGTKGLTSRHAKLAVGTASTLAVFLMETHHARSHE